ncbi:MAG: hypothetical protein NC040_05415, partial [Muribaculaceae bacterium]|nr:hypothetical protein [Muribaculaceae bacterium]
MCSENYKKSIIFLIVLAFLSGIYGYSAIESDEPFTAVTRIETISLNEKPEMVTLSGKNYNLNYSDNESPVSMHINYTLDGRNYDYSEIKGKN